MLCPRMLIYSSASFFLENSNSSIFFSVFSCIISMFGRVKQGEVGVMGMAIYTLRPYIGLHDFRDVYVPPLSCSQFSHISLTSLFTIIYVKEKKIQRGDRGTETLKVGPIFREKVKNHTFF